MNRNQFANCCLFLAFSVTETAIAVGISKSSGSSMDVSCGFVVTTMFKSFHLLLIIYVSILVIMLLFWL